MLNSTILTLNDLVIKGEYDSHPVYIPVLKNAYLPQFPEIKNEFIYISEKKDLKTIILNSLNPNSKGIRITPPGLLLTEFYETELNIDFQGITLLDLEKIIKKILIDILDVVKELNLSINENIIVIEFIKYKINIISQLSEKEIAINQIGDPVISSLLCVLTRVTKKPVLIQKIENKERNLIIRCIILTDEEIGKNDYLNLNDARA